MHEVDILVWNRKIFCCYHPFYIGNATWMFMLYNYLVVFFGRACQTKSHMGDHTAMLVASEDFFKGGAGGTGAACFYLRYVLAWNCCHFFKKGIGLRLLQAAGTFFSGRYWPETAAVFSGLRLPQFFSGLRLVFFFCPETAAVFFCPETAAGIFLKAGTGLRLLEFFSCLRLPQFFFLVWDCCRFFF